MKCKLCDKEANPKLIELNLRLCDECHKRICSKILSQRMNEKIEYSKRNLRQKWDEFFDDTFIKDFAIPLLVSLSVFVLGLIINKFFGAIWAILFCLIVILFFGVLCFLE